MEPCPTSESLQTVKPNPVACLCIEHFQGKLFTNVVCPATDDQHQRSDENARMLVP